MCYHGWATQVGAVQGRSVLGGDALSRDGQDGAAFERRRTQGVCLTVQVAGWTVHGLGTVQGVGWTVQGGPDPVGIAYGGDAFHRAGQVGADQEGGSAV